MRRIAFLAAAASIAFVAISEPISANEKKYIKCMKECLSTLSKCLKICDSGGKYLEQGFKYGRKGPQPFGKERKIKEN